MQLGDYHNEISFMLNKGTTLDSYVAAWTRRAARWIERNYTLKYMERYGTFTLLQDARNVAFFSATLKSIEFMRYADLNSEWYYLPQVDAKDVVSNDEANPLGYWLDGIDNIWFDNAPTANLGLESSYIQFTTWPTATDEEPWLLTNAEELMLAQTMILMAPSAREPEWLQYYAPMRDEGIRTLLLADEELRFSNRDERMIYDARTT